MKSATVRATVLLACTFGTLLAHAQSARPLTFDVTSVKPNTSGEQGGSSRAEPGRYVGTNVTLRRVIGLAYRPVQEFVGGPGWINADRFDIEGKVEGTPTQEQMLEMLRSLLAERFKLVVHRETREMPAYALAPARPDGRLGPALRSVPPCAAPPSPQAPPQQPPGRGPGCGGFSVGNGSMRGSGVTMTQLAAELPSATEGRYVVDLTGLAGNYDISLTWNAEALKPGDASPDAPPSIFAAIQEQLGLKLEATKAPIEVIVIDSAQRPVAD